MRSAANHYLKHRFCDTANKPRSNSHQTHTAGTIAVTAIAVVGLASFFLSSGPARLARAGRPDLVALSTIDPSIRQDMRYASARNFTGNRVHGYEAGECWLRPSVARALADVQRDLVENEAGLKLKVLDCYRPRRSVKAFVAWAGREEDGRTRNYYPNLSRPELLSLGYIGRNSTHSKGIAVDLTVVRTSPKDKDQRSVDANTACTRTSDHDFDPASLDMGTTFDCFDPKSHTARGGLTSEQHNARQTLKRYMERHGFSNYRKEWWHYTYGAADDGRSFDVPVHAAGRLRDASEVGGVAEKAGVYKAKAAATKAKRKATDSKQEPDAGATLKGEAPAKPAD